MTMPSWMRTGLPRRVEPELLDELPPDHPDAVKSRSDLQRVNRLMGNASVLLRALDPVIQEKRPRHLVELGAGDGTLMLRVARERHQRWPAMHVTLVDRQPCVSVATLDAIRMLGWQVDVLAVDVFDWLAKAEVPADTIVIANLFVHHFAGESLTALLRGLAQHAQAFVCCEPRRSVVALAGSHLLGVIGCNAITRHDAVLSVHAGFIGSELTAIWQRSCAPDDTWEIRESGARLFSHLFAARRLSLP
ncbi:MAG: hypothetical protein ABIP11_06555 [Luteimonas sp.]